MKAGFDNQMMSSFLMWFDHTLLDKGQAFYTVSSNFLPNSSNYYGYYTYSAPYKGLVYDTSISGATVMTGVYVNSTKYFPGQGTLSGVGYGEGQVFLTSPAAVSGTFSVKEFNVVLTTQAEEIILFETNYVERSKTTGLAPSLDENVIPYPVIFLRNNHSVNKPWAFGGTDQTELDVRAIVIADTQYNLDAVCSLFRDRNYDNFYLMAESDNPFNVLGSFKHGIPFNYNTSIVNKQYAIIDRVSVSKVPSIKTREHSINLGIYYGIIDFRLIKHRDPRNS